MLGIRSASNGSEIESNKWKNLLPATYSAQTPPNSNGRESDTVFIALQVLDIDEVNENEMVSIS